MRTGRDSILDALSNLPGNAYISALCACTVLRCVENHKSEDAKVVKGKMSLAQLLNHMHGGYNHGSQHGTANVALSTRQTHGTAALSY